MRPWASLQVTRKMPDRKSGIKIAPTVTVGVTAGAQGQGVFQLISPFR